MYQVIRANGENSENPTNSLQNVEGNWFYCTSTPSEITNPEEVSCETVIVNISAASFRNLEKDYYRSKANEWQTRVWVFTFADSVQSLPLHFVFISQGHGVTRSTAHGGTTQHGGYLSSSATNTDKVQTPSAPTALFPGAYRLGTYTCQKRK